MKCNICRKEFGNGTHCQSCGIDRVQGLASYSGFSPSDNPNIGPSLGRDNNSKMENLTVCFACGEIISINAEYCPKCGQKQKERCPKCGNIYSAEYEYCDACGTNRVAYLKELQQRKQEKKRQEEEARKRKDEEQKKKEIEQAIEQKQKQEAEEFKDKIRLVNVSYWFIFLFLLSLISLLFLIYSDFVLIIIILTLLGLLGWGIVTIIGNYRLRKYKKTHPDDWRIKYW